MSRVSFPANVVQNLEATAVANLVPGAEMLGYGFNIFGTYSFDSAIRPLLKLGNPGSWTAPSGTTYSLPSNVSTPGGSSSQASAYAFSSSSDFASYFQSSASVSGSIGAFSASFNGSYDTAHRSSNDYSWALVEADFIAWHVGIDYSLDIVRDDVKSDPDWSQLPSTFDAKNPDNVAAFYRFFVKFGTYFISSVATGGTLYYYFSVSKSANYTSTQITMSATAEYSGLIASGQASASASWQNCASNWTSNRQSHAMTVPGTTDIINWVNPAYGSYDSSGNFAQWKTAVVNNPSRCNFSLMPIWALFSGAKYQALQQAYRAFASNRIMVEATRSGTASILVNGAVIMPDGGYPSFQTGGWQMVVLDSKTLNVVFNRCYTFNFTASNWPDDVNMRIAADLKPYVSGNNILIAATSNIDDACSPNADLGAILRSFGASKFLNQWTLMDADHGCSSGTGSAVYAVIGASRSGTAQEGYGSTYFDNPSTHVNSPMSVALSALLMPGQNGFDPTPYS
jgi:hypothetical protein